jgi:hypothetical protein
MQYEDPSTASYGLQFGCPNGRKSRRSRIEMSLASVQAVFVTRVNGYVEIVSFQFFNHVQFTKVGDNLPEHLCEARPLPMQ